MIDHIKKADEYREILSCGQKKEGQFFVIYFKKGKKLENPAVGLIITKKLSPKATQRNYIRRIIYNFYGTNKEMITNNWRIAVRLKKKLEKNGLKTIARTIRQDIEFVSKKAGIMI